MDKLVEMMTAAAHRVVVDMAQVNEGRIKAALVDLGWMPISAVDLVAALHFLENHQDMGPHGSGYQSTQLQEVIGVLNAALAVTKIKHSEYDDE